MTIGKGKRPSAPKRDFMQVARGIVEQAIGEHMDGTVLEKSQESIKAKSGRLGGKQGGNARADKLSPPEDVFLVQRFSSSVEAAISLPADWWLRSGRTAVWGKAQMRFKLLRD